MKSNFGVIPSAVEQRAAAGWRNALQGGALRMERAVGLGAPARSMVTTLPHS